MPYADIKGDSNFCSILESKVCVYAANTSIYQSSKLEDSMKKWQPWKTILTSQRKMVDAPTLAKRWNIPLERAKKTVLATTQRGVCDMWQIPRSWGDSRPMTASWGTTYSPIPCLLTNDVPVPRHNTDTSLPRCLQHPMVGLVPYPWQRKVTLLLPLTVYLDMKVFHPKWLWMAPKNKT